MDGRRPSGLMLANTDVDELHKRDEYLRWYRDVHFPEVCAPAIFQHPLMFRNAREPTPEGEGHFLALYESDRSDLEQAASEFERHVEQLFTERRIHPGTVHRLFAIYRCRALQLSAKGQRSQSLVVLHLDAAAGRADELRRWGEERLLPAAAELGLFHTGGFHERLAGAAFASVTASDQPRFLALFESDRGDAVGLGQRLLEKLPAPVWPERAVLRSVAGFYRSAP